MSKFIIDTHALIWYLEGNPRLGSAAKSIIEDPASDLVLPIIALAEAIHIVEKSRTRISNVDDLLNDIGDDSRLEVHPLTMEILLIGRQVIGIPEMHDRLIVATGLFYQTRGEHVSILTRDSTIIQSSMLKVIWD